jgi:hypothetical protein
MIASRPRLLRKLYERAETWDRLPDSPTGTYWADGVLLGSTLVE